MPGYAQSLSTEPGKTGISVKRPLISLETDLRETKGTDRTWFSSLDRKGPFITTKLEGKGGWDGWKDPAWDISSVGRANLESGPLNLGTRVSPRANIDDVARITKLLTTTNGLAWETHNTELNAIAQKSKEHWSNKESGNLLKKIGKGLLSAVQLTATTLEQVAVTGTGVHMTPYIGHSYIQGGEDRGGILGSLLSIGKEGYDAASVALAGNKVVPGNEGHSKIQNITLSYSGNVESSVFDQFLVHSDLNSSLETRLNEFDEALGLIPFVISTITPEDRLYMVFQANLDSFDDSYTGNWDTIQYVGRGENLYNYTGFNRDISFSFKAVARTQKELLPLYNNLNHLAGSVAPNYDEQGYFMRGTLASVTIGDLLNDQKGFIKSVKFSWKQEYPWAIGKNTAGTEDTIIVPHLLDVSISFQPIHDFVPSSRSLVKDNHRYLGTHKQLTNNG